MKKISFCLPVIAKSPAGGFKVVFEYANKLSERGYDITLYFDCSTHLQKYFMPDFIRMFICKLMVYYYPRWFQLDYRIKKLAVNGINDGSIMKSDIIFATAIETSFFVANLSDEKGKKYYLIQDFENWNFSDQIVNNSFNLGMKNVAISKWLCKKVEGVSGVCSYVPNAIRTDVFKITNAIEDRNNHCVMLLYHEGVHKGLEYAFRVLEKLKQRYPDLQVNMFGTPEKPESLADWINYKRNASETELLEMYNNSSVFLCASINEGFGLTGLESMACGCALVSTAYSGVLEYAVDGYNALLSPVKDVDSLYSNIVKLFEDNELRIRIASQGAEDAKSFSWENTMKQLETQINSK